MFKRSILSLGMILCFSHTYAQRLNFTEVCQLYEYVTETNDHNIQDITRYLSENGVNWSGPVKSESETALRMTWVYKVDNHEMGEFTASKEKLTVNDKTMIVDKANYLFAYRAEYDDLLSYISSNAQLVNTFSDSRSVTRVYESKYITWALIIMPAESHQFFIDGKPVESYMLVIHPKL
jgi:hypothetical protein